MIVTRSSPTVVARDVIHGYEVRRCRLNRAQIGGHWALNLSPHFVEDQAV
jgi:hypothetical protein